MLQEERLCTFLTDETRLNIPWLRMGQEDFYVCDTMGDRSIIQFKAFRNLIYSYNVCGGNLPVERA